MSRIIGETFNAKGDFFTTVIDGVVGEVENYEESYKRICRNYLELLKWEERYKKEIKNLKKENEELKRHLEVMRKNYFEKASIYLDLMRENAVLKAENNNNKGKGV